MPQLMIKTSLELPAEQQQALLQAASARVAEMLGKSEHYVMVTLDAGHPMRFGGDDGACAYLELKSIGLPEDRTPAFSRQLCSLMQEHAGLDPARIYIEFSDIPRHLWGWDGRTF